MSKSVLWAGTVHGLKPSTKAVIAKGRSPQAKSAAYLSAYSSGLAPQMNIPSNRWATNKPSPMVVCSMFNQYLLDSGDQIAGMFIPKTYSRETYGYSKEHGSWFKLTLYRFRDKWNFCWKDVPIDKVPKQYQAAAMLLM